MLGTSESFPVPHNSARHPTSTGFLGYLCNSWCSLTLLLFFHSFVISSNFPMFKTTLCKKFPTPTPCFRLGPSRSTQRSPCREIRTLQSNDPPRKTKGRWVHTHCNKSIERCIPQYKHFSAPRGEDEGLKSNSGRANQDLPTLH